LEIELKITLKRNQKLKQKFIVKNLEIKKNILVVNTKVIPKERRKEVSKNTSINVLVKY
jgi:hypothetical protein